MSTPIEAAIAERLHQLDDRRQAEVLDFVEFLTTKSKAAADPQQPKAFDPMHYSGKVQWPFDGMIRQEAARKEWE